MQAHLPAYAAAAARPQDARVGDLEKLLSLMSADVSARAAVAAEAAGDSSDSDAEEVAGGIEGADEEAAEAADDDDPFAARGTAVEPDNDDNATDDGFAAELDDLHHDDE